MGLYNFLERFVEPVLAGRVTQTIRNPKAKPDYIGDVMHLYTGLRHTWRQLLFRAPCVRVQTVVIWRNGDVWLAEGAPDYSLLGEEAARNLPSLAARATALDQAARDAFAVADGFLRFDAMIEHYHQNRVRLPFYGGVWHWDYSRRFVEKDGASFGAKSNRPARKEVTGLALIEPAGGPARIGGGR
jgi:hypothetical protein